MVGIYCRISKQKVAGQDVSIETQRNLGIEFAKSEGLPFKTFIDEGISGTGDDLSHRLNTIPRMGYSCRSFCLVHL